MPKPKPKRKTTRSKKKRKKTSFQLSLFKAIAGLLILAVVVAGIALIANYLIPAKQPSPSVPVKTPSVAKIPAAPDKPTFEIYPDADKPVEKPGVKSVIPPEHKLPKVAIIIDDCASGACKRPGSHAAYADGTHGISLGQPGSGDALGSHVS
jgi:hypothetical protein